MTTLAPSIDTPDTASAVAELVGPGPLTVAKVRAVAAGVTFGRDARTETPHMSSSAVFVVLMDGRILAIRHFEIEALHMAAVVAERGHRAGFETHFAV